jgi:dolichol-phosphate mannosyltransferase
MANEIGTAERFVRDVLEVCDRYSFGSVTFFAILDNASRDGTIDLLRDLSQREQRLRVIWAPENRSVVDAYIRGYREALDAASDWILEIDAGYSHQPSDIPPFFDKMQEGYDCVFGTRFGEGGEIADTPLKRKVFSRGGTVLANLLLGTRLTDMTSGFELFTRNAMESVLEQGIRSRGHFFQTEIKTACKDFRTAEVPIHYRSASPSVNNAVVVDSFKNLFRLFVKRLTSR